MPHFTKRIATDFDNPEFIFNRIFTVSGVRYHVSVKDKDRKAFFFTMQEKGGEWYIIEVTNPPNWITDLEAELSQAIIEHKPLDLR
jgi:hypothetical protein